MYFNYSRAGPRSAGWRSRTIYRCSVTDDLALSSPLRHSHKRRPSGESDLRAPDTRVYVAMCRAAVVRDLRVEFYDRARARDPARDAELPKVVTVFTDKASGPSRCTSCARFPETVELDYKRRANGTPHRAPPTRGGLRRGEGRDERPHPTNVMCISAPLPLVKAQL